MCFPISQKQNVCNRETSITYVLSAYYFLFLVVCDKISILSTLWLHTTCLYKNTYYVHVLNDTTTYMKALCACVCAHSTFCYCYLVTNNYIYSISYIIIDHAHIIINAMYFNSHIKKNLSNWLFLQRTY